MEKSISAEIAFMRKDLGYLDLEQPASVQAGKERSIVIPGPSDRLRTALRVEHPGTGYRESMDIGHYLGKCAFA